ncbi:hypothetical protein TA3x_001732 [Tundrisphaera sp. TA3]|uniref:hypothetical protein n=1 Tax=Tundrisphaera sp. TA3 TaxID=3435775 RepID=UPI003EBFB62E
MARSGNDDLPNDGTELLFRAIAHACINQTRRRPPVVGLDPTLADSSEAGPEQRAICGETEAAIAAALAELPVTERAIVEWSSDGGWVWTQQRVRARSPADPLKRRHILTNVEFQQQVSPGSARR